MTRDPSLIVTVDVEGAPVRIGEQVRIVSASREDSIDPRFLGCSGIVVALVFDDPWLQYPADPLIRVRVHGLGEDLFFVRELDGLPARAGAAFRALPPARAC
ncbi:carotenogenesis protein carS [Stigmatella aurantiaca]|uniref:Carotenogenesis protein CarS n=1 Tax=Stigmatella aurantiaca (strain DW4/3-1) TaxID=378806 RepID=E3FPY6_STIAD|nr:carotenogenesis protein carS [Stigmatella aurantiaca]ADO75689.1 Carotenogenesis protein CarS [Stigmatella aurantiaca DW4/3-1]